MYKAEMMIREILLFICAISIFPFMTLRVLVWKWHFWIRENEAIINENNREYKEKYR
jgi:hypothetical protein